MPWARDPLSERYDGAAARLVGQALAAKGTWVYANVARPRPGSRIAATLAAAGLVFDATDAGGLTAWERAYQRSVYWVFNGGTGNPNEQYSLQREWGPRTRYGRLIGIRASPKPVARRAVRRKPPEQRYVQNPALRSGPAGSGQERF
jgi:hypothetical protein